MTRCLPSIQPDFWTRCVGPPSEYELDMMHMGLGTPDCPVFKGMYEYAALASGASLVGAELLLAGDVDVAFNPSGGLPSRLLGTCHGVLLRQ